MCSVFAHEQIHEPHSREWGRVGGKERWYGFPAQGAARARGEGMHGTGYLLCKKRGMTDQFFLLALRSHDPSTIFLRSPLKHRASVPLGPIASHSNLKDHTLSVCSMSKPTVRTVQKWKRIFEF